MKPRNKKVPVNDQQYMQELNQTLVGGLRSIRQALDTGLETFNEARQKVEEYKAAGDLEAAAQVAAYARTAGTDSVSFSKDLTNLTCRVDRLIRDQSDGKISGDKYVTKALGLGMEVSALNSQILEVVTPLVSDYLNYINSKEKQ